MIPSGTRRSPEAGAGERRARPERSRTEGNGTLAETAGSSEQVGKAVNKAIVGVGKAFGLEPPGGTMP